MIFIQVLSVSTNYELDVQESICRNSKLIGKYPTNFHCNIKEIDENRGRMQLTYPVAGWADLKQKNTNKNIAEIYTVITKQL